MNSLSDFVKVIFDFYHDLSKYLICGEAKNYYLVRMGFGTDTEDNDAFYLEGDWNIEFKDKFLFTLHFMVHRSVIWDSAEGKFSFKVRF